MTDADGNYTFTGLLPGDYTVEIDPASVPTNLVATADPDGANDLIAAVVLIHCDGAVSVDFGFRDQADLPVTGFDLGGTTAFGVMLLLVGAALLFVVARRRSEEL